MSPLDTYLKQYPQTRYLDAFFNDLCSVIRGKRYPVAAAQGVFETGVMLPGGSFLLAANGECMDPQGMGFSDGDPDEVARPLLHTLVPMPWAQFDTAQVMLSLQGLDGVPYYFEPRNVLRRVLAGFAELGLRPQVAFELEFYLLAGQRGAGGELVPAAAATQVYALQEIEDFSRFFDAVVGACAAQGIAAGAISAEYAPQQFEINLGHSTDLLAAADECVMFKRAVQGVARRQGFQATFMPKPFAAHSGSGLHLHLSVLDAQGRNAFDGGGGFGEQGCGSALLYHSIGGLLQTLGDFFAVLAPSVNSYRRFVPNWYVPVARSWGFENRSVAVRIPKSRGAARRVEHRVAGADANPYLALAAVLAGVLHGITHKVVPPAAAQGNAGATMDTSLRFELPAALAVCRDSAVAAHYFGKRYVQAYTSCKLSEYEAFVERKVGEVEWYL